MVPSLRRVAVLENAIHHDDGAGSSMAMPQKCGVKTPVPPAHFQAAVQIPASECVRRRAGAARQALIIEALIDAPIFIVATFLAASARSYLPQTPAERAGRTMTP